MKKAFTLIEVMFVVVLIGLLTAIMSPIYVHVRTNQIAKQVYYGEPVTREQYHYLEKNMQFVNDVYLSKRKVLDGEQQTMPAPPAQTIVIDGRKYKLVPE